MDFWGSLRVQKILVYLRTRIFGFRKNAEKAQIIAVFIESKTMLDAL